MKIKCFSTLTNVIQKFEQVKLKNLLLGEKNYLLSLKKLSVLDSLTPYTRLEPTIRSGRTMYTIKPMLGRTYRSARFILDSIKDQKVAFEIKLKKALNDPAEAHLIKKKFQGELLEARLNLRTRRRRKRFIKKRFSLIRPPHWMEFKTPTHKLRWIKEARKKNTIKLQQKLARKLNNRYIRLEKRRKANLKYGLPTKQKRSGRWLVIHNLRRKIRKKLKNW